MAKKSVNKSQAVRHMLAQHPEAKASEIVGLLAAKRIKFSENLVYGIKGKMKGESAVVKSPKAATTDHMSAITAKDLETVGDVVAKLGAEKVKAIVAFVERVKG